MNPSFSWLFPDSLKIPWLFNIFSKFPDWKKLSHFSRFSSVGGNPWWVQGRKTWAWGWKGIWLILCPCLVPFAPNRPPGKTFTTWYFSWWLSRTICKVKKSLGYWQQWKVPAMIKVWFEAKMLKIRPRENTRLAPCYDIIVEFSKIAH